MLDPKDLLKKRVYALTTDFFIIIVTNYFFVASFTNFLKTVFFSIPLRAQLFLIHKLAIMTSVSLTLLSFAYFSLFYFVTNGHTMGKSLFGLRVYNIDKSEMTLIQCMKRSFSYFACAMLGSLPFILSFVRKDQKSFADLFSKSSVGYEKESNNQGSEFQLSLLQAEFVQDNEENKAA